MSFFWFLLRFGRKFVDLELWILSYICSSKDFIISFWRELTLFINDEKASAFGFWRDVGAGCWAGRRGPLFPRLAWKSCVRDFWALLRGSRDLPRSFSRFSRRGGPDVEGRGSVSAVLLLYRLYIIYYITCWLWFVILKKYVELTWPKIKSRDPIFFTGTQACSRVSGNDRLFPRGSKFGPNPEIPASPVIQLRPRPDDDTQVHHQIMPTAPSCIVLMYSWRSTTLSQRKKLTSSTTNLEWCHVHLRRDSYSTFISRVIWPGKNSMELFFNTKFHFKSTQNHDWATFHRKHPVCQSPAGTQEINQCLVKVYWNELDYSTPGTGVLGQWRKWKNYGDKQLSWWKNHYFSIFDIFSLFS